MNWNEIENAPKDNEDILCYCDDYQIVLRWIEYEDDGSSWCPQVFNQKNGWNDYQNQIHYPTYWMPLPENPKDI